MGNRDSAVSRQIVEYYRPRRSIPAANVCWLSTTTDEEVDWNVYQSGIEGPVGDCLKKASLQEKVLYIVITLGTPLKIDGTNGPMATRSSVDSELALLYSKLNGVKVRARRDGPQPFFQPCATRRSAIRNFPSTW